MVGGAVVGSYHVGPLSSSIFFVEYLFSFSPLSGDATVIEISFVVFGGSNDDVKIFMADDQPIYLPPSSYISEIETILVKDPCDNPVYLFWKNSLGGDSFWLFDGSQDLSWMIADYKAKRLLLFAENINANEFDAINEAQTPGLIYGTPMIELTDDVISTSQKTDQQLYVIDDDGNKLGVINIPSDALTRTLQRGHNLSILIEYPEQL